ncbi:MAG: hypothetical protein HYZ15_06495 [Sphingobacteriales bacterium]|nr:hypothetical protein [Sphingobacteriales bacterium]
MKTDELYELREAKGTSDEARKIIDLLLQAINDWPGPVDTVENYLSKVKLFLGTKNLNYHIIKKGINSQNPGIYLWEFESLSSLLELAEINKKAELQVILLWHRLI